MTRFQFVLLSFLCASIPFTAQAKLDLYNPKKIYKDEGVAPANAASRCTGASFQKAQTAAVAAAKKSYDTMKAQGKVNAAILDRAYTKYQEDLAAGWNAMQQPYCGFGAFGVTAALHSLNKTIVDAQKKFSVNVKATSLNSIAVSAASPQGVIAAVVPAIVPAPKVAAVKESVSTPKKTTSASLTRLLKRGMRNDEVKQVQEVLIEKGYLQTDSATGYFGNQTEAALIKFQLKKKVIQSAESPGSGWVGPKTRAILLGE